MEFLKTTYADGHIPVATLFISRQPFVLYLMRLPTY